MREKPLLSEQAKKLTVKIQTIEEIGSGIIYLPKNQEDKVFILTARHCLCGKDKISLPRSSTIKIEVFCDKEKCYHSFDLPNDRIILFFEENKRETDIALISLCKKDFPLSLDEWPTFNLIDDTKGIRNTIVFGFPAGSPNEELERVDTILQLPAERFIWKAEPQRALEAEDFDFNSTAKRGFSGGGFLVNTLDEFFLFGIVTESVEWNRFLGVKADRINDLLKANNLPLESIYEIEANENIKQAIQFLDRNSNIIRENIRRKSSLGKTTKITLDRITLQKQLFAKLEHKKVSVINAPAGYGKSVLAEKTLTQLEKKYSIWAIKAEQLIDKSIDTWFLEKGWIISFQDVLNSPLLFAEKIILIESAERLLETQKLDGLEALLELVDNRTDLKVLFTIRDYALNMLITFPKNEYTSIEIPSISEEEMSQVVAKYPQLEELLNNNKIKQLLNTPFYLNFVLQLLPNLISNENLNERKLKVELWKKIVENGNTAKGQLFERLALKRASEMHFYVSLEDANQQIISGLLKDEIIIKFEDRYGNCSYAPAHDIFEDWVLVKYIQKQRKQTGEDLIRFYNNISGTYAIRRGFRFWMQEELKDTRLAMFFYQFIEKSLQDVNIKPYWKDAILLAILKSDKAANFLNKNKKQLLKEEAKLLIRLFHLLRTACHKPFLSVPKGKEQAQTVKSYSFNFEPIGQSWAAIITFIYQNQQVVEQKSTLILDLFLDWQKKLKHPFTLPDESRMVGEILLNMLRREMLDSSSSEKALKLLLRLTKVMKTEVQTILEHSLALFSAEEEREKRFRLNLPVDFSKKLSPIASPILPNRFYRKILELALSCFEAKEICYFLPDVVIQLAKEVWLLKKQEREVYHSSLGLEECFGLSQYMEFRYSPTSAYQTPIYFLLKFHPFKALQFIVDIVNYSTENYRQSSFGQKHDIKENAITLNSGEKVKKWGNQTLWVLYRSSSVGTSRPYLLESMMMALEKWMLSLGKSKQKKDHQTLIEAVKFLLKNSCSVMTTAVVASISMAYPFILKQELLPIFTALDFFDWDRVRWHFRDKTTYDALPHQAYIFKERKESFNLTHRKEKLELLLARLSFYRDFKKPIFDILDKHYQETDKNDYTTLCKLYQMDIRYMEVAEHPDNALPNKPPQFILNPKVPDKLQEFVTKNEEEKAREVPFSKAIAWAMEIVNENKGEIDPNTFDNWKKYKAIFLTSTSHPFYQYFQSPSGLAYIGLAHHFSKLSVQERNWCIDAILEAGKKVLQNKDWEMFDKEVNVKALPLLLDLPIGEDKILIAKMQIIYMLLEIDLPKDRYNKFFDTLSKEIWKNDYSFGNQCFRVLYYHALLEKSPNNNYFYTDKTKVEVYQEKQAELVEKGVRGAWSEITTFDIVLEHPQSYDWTKVFMFLPEKAPFTQELELFRASYEKVLFSQTYQAKKRGRDEDRDDKMRFLHDSGYYQDKSAKLLFYQQENFCKPALSKTLQYILYPEENCRATYSTVKLIAGILDKLIYLEADFRNDERFWYLWQIIYEESLALENKLLASSLLFKTELDLLGGLHDWEPLHGKKDFLQCIIQNFGEYDIEATVNLVARMGGLVLFPEGILQIKQIMEKSEITKISHAFHYENLINRAFVNHRKVIQENPAIFCAYNYLLDLLVESGSSCAFAIREIITTRIKKI